VTEHGLVEDEFMAATRRAQSLLYLPSSPLHAALIRQPVQVRGATQGNCNV